MFRAISQSRLALVIGDNPHVQAKHIRLTLVAEPMLPGL